MPFVKSIICSVLVFLLSVPLTASAQTENKENKDNKDTSLEEWTDFPPEDSPKPKLRLPPGEITTLNKVSYTCFNLNEYKELLTLANEYQALYDWKLKTQVIAHTWQDLDQIYNERITNVKDQLKLLRADRSNLIQRITDQEKYILKLQQQKDANLLGWKIVAGLELVGILTLSVAAMIQK